MVFATVQNALYLPFWIHFKIYFYSSWKAYLMIKIIFIKKEGLIILSVDLALDKLWIIAKSNAPFF